MNRLRESGFDVQADGVRRLSPPEHDHINLLGRYQFSSSDLADGQLRPLRDPTAPDI